MAKSGIKKFEQLVLIVGTNPLPDLAAALFFLKENIPIQKIWLVYSEENKELNQDGTIKQAENLRKLLKRNFEGAFGFISISNVSRSKEIERCFKKQCLDFLSEKTSVHLNYTGGTKVVSTTIYQLIANTIDDTSFSYLDPRKYKLLFDDEYTPASGDLREKISISFEEMITLHGYERIHMDSRSLDETFSETCKAFEALIDLGKINGYFDENNGGYKRKLFEHKRKENKLADKKKYLKHEELCNYSPNDSFKYVLTVLPEGYRFLKDGCFTVSEFKNDSNLKYTIGFLDGKWLELYIHKILVKRLLGKFFISSVETDWEIRQDQWQNERFQLDNIIVRGFQLIGISCTTSPKKDLCKNKGFEIIYRCQQIGGIESKAILVTRLPDNNKEALEKELQLDTGSGKKIMVLGINDLKEDIFVNRVSEFIND